jgi:hypothetical protein
VDSRQLDTIMRVFSNAFPGHPSFEVTHLHLILGERDATTGWYSITYVSSTINMVIVQKSAQNFALKLGYFVNLDALSFTATPLEVYDRIVDFFGRKWEVKTMQPIVTGDVVQYFLCDLKELPLYA